MLGLGSMATAGRALDAEAAGRPTPTPKPVKCPGQQTWNGNACVCPGGLTTCGSDCCPADATGCDNACCYGTCYGEELCCATGTIFCDGACRPWECCSDGCGGTCTCPQNEECSEGTCICVDGTTRCPNGACQECCETSSSSEECVEKYGGDAGCWACSDGTCQARTGMSCSNFGFWFCSELSPGSCTSCGSLGDYCGNGAVCCDGLACDLSAGTSGHCVECSEGMCECLDGTTRCPNGACQECCEPSSSSDECAQQHGGYPGCWACSEGICQANSGGTPCLSDGHFCSEVQPGFCW